MAGVETPDYSPSREAKQIETDFAQEMRERFKECETGEEPHRREGLEDLRFRAGKQWDPGVERSRKALERPVVTANQIPQFIAQVANEQRMNRPAIRISPRGDTPVSKETAEVLQGICRSIEVNSHAESAYDHAFEQMLVSGLGYFRIITDYDAPGSFDQEIRIEWIESRFSVYYDQAVRKQNWSDAKFCFIGEWLSLRAFRKRFPKAQASSAEQFRSLGDDVPRWITDQKIRVVEYYYIEDSQKTLCELEDGTTHYEDELSGLADEYMVSPEQIVAMVKRRRVETVPVVKWRLMTGVETLKETTWAGRYIPIIPVLGTQIDLDGQRDLIGMVRFLRDPQRIYDYAWASVIEECALKPKVGFIATSDQLKNQRDDWNESNRVPKGVLTYEFQEGAQEPHPPQFNTQIAAYSALLQQAEHNLQVGARLYNPSLGANSNETSGKAILARQSEGDVANFNYIDNLSRSIQYCGVQLIDLIPKIYDTPAKVLHIVKPDGTTEAVAINPPKKPEDAQDLALPEAIKKIHDLGVASFMVSVEVGPSYATKRKEASTSLLEAFKAVPMAQEVAPDILFRALDGPDFGQVADRLKKMLPANLQEEQDQEIPPALAAKMQQMSALLDAQTKTLNQMSEDLNTKRLELESKERIAALQGQVQLIVADLRSGGAMAETLAALEFSAIKQRLQLLHERDPIVPDEPNQAGAPPEPPPIEAPQQAV